MLYENTNTNTNTNITKLVVDIALIDTAVTSYMKFTKDNLPQALELIEQLKLLATSIETKQN